MKTLRGFIDSTQRWTDGGGLPFTTVYDYFRDLDRIVREFVAERTPVTVAKLPAAGDAGRRRFASDGRKNGEASGHGTGVLVFDDGVHWIACDTGATVAA